MTKIEDIAKDIEAEIENAEEETRAIQVRITRLRAARASLLGSAPAKRETNAEASAPSFRAHERGTSRERLLGAIRFDGRAMGLRTRAGLSKNAMHYHLQTLKGEGAIRFVGTTIAGRWEIVS